MQFGLIGFPLKNSFSKDYFTRKFIEYNLTQYSYNNFAIEDINELKNVLANNPNLKGFNVTTPHKENIIPLLNGLDESAQNVGAVNCVKIEQPITYQSLPHSQAVSLQLIGYNTDIYGFELSLKNTILNNKKTVKNALILGTGGAAKAVAFVLHKMGIEYIFVSRNQKAYPLSLSANTLTNKIIQHHTLIVNCTPIGMYPSVNYAPAIPYQYITNANICFDLIYLPHETLFLKQAKERGAAIKNGFEMLQLQAEKSWNIWNS